MLSAVFLDRDGVIIHNRDNYVRSWKDVEFYPFSLEALKALSQTEYQIIITTNQSAIGRGILTISQSDAINHRIIEEITNAGGRVDGVYTCPHCPEDHCLCRKPQPGLILDAAEERSIHLPSSIMIGDALTDIQAGFSAGINKLLMVKTGRGNEQSQRSQSANFPQFIVTDNLLSASAIVVSSI